MFFTTLQTQKYVMPNRGCPSYSPHGHIYNTNSCIQHPHTHTAKHIATCYVGYNKVLISHSISAWDGEILWMPQKASAGIYALQPLQNQASESKRVF